MKIFLIITFNFGIVFVFTGCGSVPSKEKESSHLRLPPTELGVRITPDGCAVAEVDRPPEEAFEIVENKLREDLKVTFVNRSIWKIEAQPKKLRIGGDFVPRKPDAENNYPKREEGGMLFEVDLAALTTGKTGLTIKATNRDEKTVDHDAASKLADKLVEAVKASPSKVSTPTQ